jgi:hypothetical protein
MWPISIATTIVKVVWVETSGSRDIWVHKCKGRITCSNLLEHHSQFWRIHPRSTEPLRPGVPTGLSQFVISSQQSLDLHHSNVSWKMDHEDSMRFGLGG